MEDVDDDNDEVAGNDEDDWEKADVAKLEEEYVLDTVDEAEVDAVCRAKLAGVVEKALGTIHWANNLHHRKD